MNLGRIRLALAMFAVLALLVVPAMAGAEAVTSTDMVTVPYDETVVSPCNGEPVVLSGSLLLIFHTTMDANGGFHGDFTLVPQQVRGVGVVSGTQYKAVGGTRSTFNTNGATEFTSTDTYNLVSQGGIDNVLVTSTFHITFDANGVPTAVVDNFNLKCVG